MSKKLYIKNNVEEIYAHRQITTYFSYAFVGIF